MAGSLGGVMLHIRACRGEKRSPIIDTMPIIGGPVNSNGSKQIK
jgi:hypothetical protein